MLITTSCSGGLKLRELVEYVLSHPPKKIKNNNHSKEFAGSSDNLYENLMDLVPD